MPIYKLERTQIIRATVAECWDFFSNPNNLRAITPESLDFQVLSEVPEVMYGGLMIQYRVRPLLGLPMTWLTEISRVEAPHYFVDEQRVGPYKIWHHEHFFRDLGDGRIECRDLVHYVPPFGPLGALVHPMLIAPQLRKIFNHRHIAVERIFAS